MLYHQIPGKAESLWLGEVKAVVDRIFDSNLTLSQYKKMVMEAGMDQAIIGGAVAWIVDASMAQGNFPDNILTFFQTYVFDALINNEIKYFLFIPSKSGESLVSDVFIDAARDYGLTIKKVKSMQAAKDWLGQNAAFFIGDSMC